MTAHRNVTPEQRAERLKRRHALRRDATDAEALPWRLLRDRQLGANKLRRQHPYDPYALGFYCPAARLAVEADGGQHWEPTVATKDAARTAYLARQSVRVLRFSNREILTETDAVLRVIAQALAEAPSP